MLILLKAFHTFHIFSVGFNRFPELSRTCGLFPGLSDSPGKCQNKIPGFQDPYEPCEKHGRIYHFQANLSSFNIAPVEIDKD